ncbi:Poly [ADP-ribose] polymerase 3 [Chamberlinius hualienensis]
MPPKRRAAAKNASPATNTKAAKAASRKTKVAKSDDEDDEPAPKMQRKDSKNTQIKKAFEKIKGEEKESKKSGAKLDEHYIKSGIDDAIYEDYACMLNQTNINANNNKYYVIQLVERKKAKSFAVFTRWGRVGEAGKNSSNLFKKIEDATKEFKKKFKDKTKNDWDDRENFQPQSGKYTLLEMDHDDDDEEEQVDVKMEKTVVCRSDAKFAPSKLDRLTLDFIKRIFSEDMFNNAMEDFNLDIKKMPLGKLSKTQIAKGFDVLVAIEESLKTSSNLKVLESLSSEFYTLIPHAFGRNRPVTLSSNYLVNKKKEMLLVLSDIELTQSLQKVAQVKIDNDLQPNPWDEKYDVLHCNLSVLLKSSEEYKAIETYFLRTSERCYVKVKIENVWKVNRDDEGSRFEIHDNIKERKLLWHGTNIAVVAAILSSGLRIMPHSGGRVGKGIYFASEHSKSFGYTCCDRDRVYIMFLNEVALGKEHTITQDNCSFRQAPSGYDSVVARGTQEPDPKLDTKLILDGKEVVVPQGKPIKTKFTKSSFDQSEYLVYKESQVRIRYAITFTDNNQ